jgi:hypothetical protein
VSTLGRNEVPPEARQEVSSIWMVQSPVSKQHAKPSLVKSTISTGAAAPSRLSKRRAVVEGASSPSRIQP